MSELETSGLRGSRSPGGWSLSEAELQLLALLADSTFPVGARLAQERLREAGHEVSEATASRLLLRLDDEGLTERAGRKGRVVTPEGERLARSMVTRRRRDRELAAALDITTLQQVLDLLCARRAVETEAARAAAAVVRPADLRTLRRLVMRQRSEVSKGASPLAGAMEFHRAVAHLSGKPLLVAMAGMVLNSDLDYLESVLDVITGGHGTMGHSGDEHAQVLAALGNHDGLAAARAMYAHLSRLIDEVNDFAASGRADVFERVLNLAQT